jgi:hypothetical protein
MALSSNATSSTVNRASLLQSIHALEPKEHITIGTILRKYQQVKLNENKGGIVINMATIPDEALEEIQKFVEYIRDQQKVLAKIENETNTYKQFFQ